MILLVYVMERGVGKLVEFFLKYGILFIIYLLFLRDYNKVYNFLLMYILNFEFVVK